MRHLLSTTTGVALATALAAALLGPLAAAESDGDLLDKMEIEHAGDHPVASPAAETAPAAEVSGEAVTYATLDGTAVEGYLALPADVESAPAGVILIHEWWGLNDNIRAVARRLAGEGYAALAVDLYEGEVGEDREGASRLARAAGERPDRLTENLRQAADYLARERGVERLGVIGWCFGGGWSLRAALALPESFDATVIYYGRVTDDPDELESLDSPVLGLFAAEDGGIPPSAVRAFQAALVGLGKEASIHIYEGADHAFANPSGTRYNEAAATDAWLKTLAFFAEHLR